MDEKSSSVVSLYVTFLTSFFVGAVVLLFFAGSLGRPVLLVGFNIAQLFSPQPTDATSLSDLPWVLYLVISAVVFMLPVLLRKWWSVVAFLALLMWILFGFCNQGLLFESCQSVGRLEGVAQFVVFAFYISCSYFFICLFRARLTASHWVKGILIGVVPVLLAPVASVLGIAFVLGIPSQEIGWIFAGLTFVWFVVLLIQDLRKKNLTAV